MQGSIQQPLAMPGWCEPGSTGCVPHVPEQFCPQGMQKVTCG